MCIHKILTSLLLFGAAFCSAEILIVGGTNSDITRYPFIVSLRNSDNHICGGSILTPTWVLTAAHCIKTKSVDTWSVQYGLTKITRSGQNAIRVKRFVPHPKYDNSYGFVNDIAVLELSEKIIFNNKTVAPAKLPEKNYEVPQGRNGARGILIGWGFSRTRGPVTTTLQEANIAIHSESECNIRYNYTLKDNQIVYKNYKLKDTQICADDYSRGQCYGDSGGPLAYESKNGLIVVGTVSWSIKPCGRDDGAYTKVSKYIDWINDNIN